MRRATRPYIPIGFQLGVHEQHQQSASPCVTRRLPSLSGASAQSIFPNCCWLDSCCCSIYALPAACGRGGHVRFSKSRPRMGPYCLAINSIGHRSPFPLRRTVEFSYSRECLVSDFCLLVELGLLVVAGVIAPAHRSPTHPIPSTLTLTTSSSSPRTTWPSEDRTLRTVMASLPPNAHVSAHPCVRAKLSQLRSQSTAAREVKSLIHEIATIVGVEAMATCLQAVPSGTVCLLSFYRFQA